MAGLGLVARAEQVEPGYAAALVGIGIDLLLDGEPATAEALRPQPQPPVQVHAALDLADGGLGEREILGIPEPACEPARDRLGAVPFSQARRQQGTQARTSGERATESGEVLSGEALDERRG